MSFAEDLNKIVKGRDNGLLKLIVINVVLFISGNLFIGISRLSGYSGSGIYDLLGLSSDPSFFLIHFWTLITYMFLQIDILHILFNMLWLYWMGKIFVEFIGSKQLVSTYLLGGVSGGLLFLMFGMLFPGMLAGLPMIGASASVMAVIISIAFLIPNYTFQVFLIGEVKLKYIALVAFLLSLIDLYSNTGGKIAHIGGAVYGYMFIVQYRKGKDLGAPLNKLLTVLENFFRPRNRNKIKIIHKRPLSDEAFNLKKKSDEKHTDEILDKISRTGYDSLNKEEREFLFKQGK